MEIIFSLLYLGSKYHHCIQVALFSVLQIYICENNIKQYTLLYFKN